MRARKGIIISGVCRGLADFLSLDVSVLRFAFVALALVSGGAFLFVYAVLWLLLPAQSWDESAVDIDPGGSQPVRRRGLKGLVEERRKARAAVGCIPPDPPVPPGTEVFNPGFRRSNIVSFFVLASILIVVAGFCSVVASFFPMFGPLHFWPLLIIALGIVRMVVPGSAGYRMEAFSGGVLVALVGGVLLLNTLDIIFTDPVYWLLQGWPLLMMTIGCIVLWKATSMNGFAAVALVLIAVFCVVGVLFCSVVGPTFHLLSGASSIHGSFWPGA